MRKALVPLVLLSGCAAATHPTITLDQAMVQTVRALNAARAELNHTQGLTDFGFKPCVFTSKWNVETTGSGTAGAQITVAPPQSPAKGLVGASATGGHNEGSTVTVTFASEMCKPIAVVRAATP